MLRATTVTRLRADLASLLRSLEEGPELVPSRNKPAAVLIDPAKLDSLVERIEILEDLMDGRQAVAEYLADPNVALDAERVFGRLNRSSWPAP